MARIKQTGIHQWIACAFVLGTVSLSAQTPMATLAISSDEDYSKAMKEVGMQSAALRKSIATPSVPDATAASQRLEAIFKDVQAYWENKKVDDATRAAKNAVLAAQSISKSVAAGDMGAADAGAQSLNATCMTCHTAHRDRLPDGTFKMK